MWPMRDTVMLNGPQLESSNTPIPDLMLVETNTFTDKRGSFQDFIVKLK